MKIISYLLPIFLVLYSHSNANASERNYAGAGCQSLSLLPVWNGQIYNNTSKTVAVQCPVIKDILNGRIASAWTRVVDRNAAEDVSCILQSSPTDLGTPGRWHLISRGKSIGSGSKVQEIRFGSMGRYGVNGYYHLYCYLPAKTSLVAYFVDEELDPPPPKKPPPPPPPPKKPPPPPKKPPPPPKPPLRPTPQTIFYFEAIRWTGSGVHRPVCRQDSVFATDINIARKRMEVIYPGFTITQITRDKYNRGCSGGSLGV